MDCSHGARVSDSTIKGCLNSVLKTGREEGAECMFVMHIND